MFIRCSIIKWCVRAPRPKRHARETLIITTAIQIGWVEWPEAPRRKPRVEWGGRWLFPWMNQYCSPLCCYAKQRIPLWICLRQLKSFLCSCVCLCQWVDLAVILPPLRVNSKTQALMKKAEYITLQWKMFFFPLDIVIWACVSWGSTVC